MKEKVLEILRQTPSGMRLRDIAGITKIHRLDLITILHELKNEKLVRADLISDSANLEWYDLWKII